MPTPDAIRVARVTADRADCLDGLAVRSDQAAWVGALDAALADLARCPDCDSMAVWLGASVIGHYRLDPHPRSIVGQDLPLPTLGLRAFFIDARWQGRGLGTAALRALVADCARRHPRARQLAAGVGADNQAALHLYCAGGFVTVRELYRDGHGMAQLLLLRSLP